MSSIHKQTSLTAFLILFFMGMLRSISAQTTAPYTFRQTDEFTLKTALSGTQFPLITKLKEMNSDWRKISTLVSIWSDSYMDTVIGMYKGADNHTYYTRGDTTLIGDQPYIIAYQPKRAKIDYAALRSKGGMSNMPAPEKMTPDTTLYLAILN